MSEENIYKVIVVGAGIMGSATAYYLSKEYGKKVLLLEQFDFLHRKGSSHGESRLIRATYAEDHYTVLMKDAYKLWKEAEEEYGSIIFTKTGGLDISKPENPYFQSIIASAKKYNLDVELLTREQVTEKFPVMKLSPGLVALYSPDGGTLNATKSVAMYQSMAHKNGCVLKDNAIVKKIQENVKENIVTVHITNGQIYRAKKVIVTAGPWSKKLLKETQGLDLPLATKLSTVSYWKVDDPASYSSDRFPVQLLHGDIGHEGYGAFPLREYPNMIKCASFDGTDCNPDDRTFGKGDGKIETVIGEYLRTMLTGVDTQPTLVESCIYTQSPDFDFILDKIQGTSGNGNIIIGCGFSGHGFKLAPVVGTILSQLAITGRDAYPDEISKFFKLNRFKN